MLFEAILFLTLLVATFIIILERMLSPILLNSENIKSQFTNYKYTTPKLVRFAQAILPAVILLFIIRSFIFEGFRVSSVSMQPTLNSGDLIVVDKYSAGLRVPLLGYRFSKTNLQRGDVIVMRGNIVGQTMPLIKRVVGLSGDKILNEHSNLIVPPNSYYVLGDNCDKSYDSRMFGVVADREIIGRARLKIFGSDKSKHETKIFKAL